MNELEETMRERLKKNQFMSYNHIELELSLIHILLVSVGFLLWGRRVYQYGASRSEKT